MKVTALICLWLQSRLVKKVRQDTKNEEQLISQVTESHLLEIRVSFFRLFSMKVKFIQMLVFNAVVYKAHE